MLAELDEVRAAQWRADLLEATIQGDRAAMDCALVALSSLLPDAEPLDVLCALVLGMLQRGAGPSVEVHVTAEQLAATGRPFLERFAYNVARVVYPQRARGSVH